MPLRPFGVDVEVAARNHAMAAYPNEAAGAIAGGAYVPLENLAPDPTEAFEVDAAQLLHLQPQALIHSHADAPPNPSAADMRQQAAMDIPWGLLSTDGKDATPLVWWGPGIPIPPLLGRDFRHGPSGSDGKGDCYALIKDFYQLELGISLVEGPRDWNWWAEGGDLYRDNFAKAGFHQVDFGDIRRGDVLLAAVMAPVLNHGGVYLGNGLLIHHLTNRLSREEPVHRWRSYITMCLRHEALA